jgi:hypothetical protein
VLRNAKPGHCLPKPQRRQGCEGRFPPPWTVEERARRRRIGGAKPELKRS